MKVLFDWVIGLGALAGLALLIWVSMLLITREKIRRVSINKRKILLFLAAFILFAIIPWLFGHYVVHWVMDLFHSQPAPDLHHGPELPEPAPSN